MKIRRRGSPGWSMFFLVLPLGIGIVAALLLPRIQHLREILRG